MKKYSILYLLVMLFTASCERFIEIDLPDFEPQFVIQGKLEPGLPIHIIISKPKGPLEDINYGEWVDDKFTIGQFEIIKDAQVEIVVDGQTSYPLHFEEYFLHEGDKIDMGRYTTEDLIIEAGRTYELIVSGSSLPTARSKVVIPDPVDINSVLVERGRPVDGLYLPMVDFTLSFTDPNENNFYEVTAVVEPYEYEINVWGDTVALHKWPQDAYPELKNPIYGENRGFAGGAQSLITDRLFNGREISLEYHCYPPYYAEGFNVRVYLRNISEDWYKYETTAHLQRSNRADPLAQPVQVHSNITNGLGILKAGTATHYEVNVQWEMKKN
jgi:hypothetical protein